MVHAAVLGIGQWRPDEVRTNDAWPAGFGATPSGIRAQPEALLQVRARADDAFSEIVRRYLALEGDDPFVGAKRRRIAAHDITCAEAEARAAEAALAHAELSASQIDVVLGHAYLPDRPAVPNAPRVMKRLGMQRALALDLDNAYASALTQLFVAASLIETGRARNVLLTQSHLVTRALPLSHPVSPNFGDLATALVVGASDEPGLLAQSAQTHAEYADSLAWTREADESRWWEAGGAFALGTLDARGTERAIARTVGVARETVLEACRAANVEVEQVRLLCTVQPRGWLPHAIAEALGLDPALAPSTFAELAHVGACGVVANLLQGLHEQRLRRGEVVAFYAQGAGLTRCSAVVRWTRNTG
jgi:3-oxoacyl-[acyl-carrier-protein] synthase-3